MTCAIVGSGSKMAQSLSGTAGGRTHTHSREKEKGETLDELCGLGVGRILRLAWTMKWMHDTRRSREKCMMGGAQGPSPRPHTRDPQKNWSPKKGKMVVGHWQGGEQENTHPEESGQEAK